MFNGLSKEYCISGYPFAKEVIRLRRKSGLLFTALYLKQCSSALMKAYANDPIVGTSPFPVSLTRSGYPRIIPAFHRRIIYRKDERSDKVVQLYLTWFSVAKVIVLAKPITKETFRSITDLPKDMDSVRSVVGELKTHGMELIYRYLPGISTIPIHQGISWEPTWKSVPNVRIPVDLLEPRYRDKPVRSAFLARPYELFAYETIRRHECAQEEFFSSSILWYSRIRYAIDPMNTTYANKDLDWFEKWVGSRLPSFEDLGITGAYLGKLGMVIEGGGKRRIFAIGNHIKQRLCYPYHVWLMQILKRISSDGTFNQYRPLDNLVGRLSCLQDP